MIEKYFKRGREYFTYRNFKYETIFHMAAHYNSVDAIDKIVRKSSIVDELFKKDYKGDTACHVAAKSGHWEILEYFFKNSIKSIMSIQNDFGFNIEEVIKEKIRFLDEKGVSEMNVTLESLKDLKKEESPDKAKVDEKLRRVRELLKKVEAFKEFRKET